MISINVSGDIKRITNALYNAPPYVATKALTATGKAMTQEILPEQSPPYSYVSRKRAYGGDGFFSDAQRKFVMAAIAEGRIQIPYRRTGSLELSYVWTLKGYELTITNLAAHAPYVIGLGTQSTHEKMVGWVPLPNMPIKNQAFAVFKQAADQATREFNAMPTASKAAAGRI